MKMLHVFRSGLSVMCVLALSGCGGGSTGPAVHPVTGVVLRDGSPLADVNVEFLPEKGRPSAATTDKDGKFVLEYTQGTRGALKGAHRVRVMEKFRGGTADGVTAIDPYNPPPEPKTYDLPQPARVNPSKNSFVIDVTTMTMRAS